MTRDGMVFLRTARHPASRRYPDAPTFDHHYEADDFAQVYRSIVADLIKAAHQAPVVYAVPGSPTVAERTVALLRAHPAVVGGGIELVVHPSVSFVDLALLRLEVDPVAVGFRLVDGENFSVQAAGQRGPLLVAQCWNQDLLSDIKLAVESPVSEKVTVLFHLGLPDERVWEVPWDELDRSFDPDHLTSLWIPELNPPVGAELLALDELVHTLRIQCPWDREQTHGSLARHLLEESYEVLEAIDALAALDALNTGTNTGTNTEPDEVPASRLPTAEATATANREATAEVTDEATERAVAHLEEELGDLLFQVYFHAVLGAEQGRFNLADVARGVHDKLVSRHPHVFGDAKVATPGDLAISWEALKMAEKSRSTVTEGIPSALPALALAAKLQRKAGAIGMELPTLADDIARVSSGLVGLDPPVGGGGKAWDGRSEPDGGGPGADDGSRLSDGRGRGDADSADNTDNAEEVGELLFALVNVARTLGVDPETALRIRATKFRQAVDERGPGGLGQTGLEQTGLE
jgi:tetrapyrrole methylase family protein/MazG family protein